MPQQPSFNQAVMKDLAGYLTQEQIRKIYHACSLLRDQTLIRVLWKSGRRISEVLQLQVRDISFEEKRILWNILKKGRPYRVWKPIDTKTLELLAYYVTKAELSDREHLFHTGYPEKPMTRQRAFQIVRKACKVAGIDTVGDSKPHPHHFRHSFAIDMAKKLKSPADVSKLQKYMEHSNLGATQVYLQFNDSEMGELLED